MSGADLSDAIEQLSAGGCAPRAGLLSLTWQETLSSRHPARPYPLDYIDGLFTDWTESRRLRGMMTTRSLEGAIRGHPRDGIGHQKGRNTKETSMKLRMPPMDTGKALRLMELANRYGRPS